MIPGQPRLIEVACWAHAHAIYEVYKSNGSPLATEALERIAELFEIETRINGRAPQERMTVRQQEAVPLLRRLESYLNNALGQISRKSTLAKAQAMPAAWERRRPGATICIRQARRRHARH
jgi:transposase